MLDPGKLGRNVTVCHHYRHRTAGDVCETFAMAYSTAVTQFLTRELLLLLPLLVSRPNCVAGSAFPTVGTPSLCRLSRWQTQRLKQDAIRTLLHSKCQASIGPMERWKLLKSTAETFAKCYLWLSVGGRGLAMKWWAAPGGPCLAARVSQHIYWHAVRQELTSVSVSAATDQLYGAQHHSIGHQLCSHSRFSSVLWNPKFYYRDHKTSTIVAFLSQTNPAHTTSSYL
jgi:hypothetical protein